MSVEELPEKIRLLVDHLRGTDTDSITLADVASVTEVLIGTMQSYFRSIDTQIYRECRTLADYIDNARKEIAALEPDDLESAKIPRAGMELDAIVQHTETATNTIMECAEAIMNADSADEEAYKATVQDNIMQIFEACSFQDITGQRISKVVQTLSHVELRLNELRELLGVTEDDIATAASASPDDGSAMHGPALEGEGIDQSEVDALFDQGEGAARSDSESAPAESAPANPGEDQAAGDASAKPDDKNSETGGAAAQNAETPESGETKKAAKPTKSSKSRQQEIDALFG